MYIHVIYIYVCMYVCMFVCMYVCICICICIYIPAAVVCVPSNPAELCIIARAPPAKRVFVLSLLAFLLQNISTNTLTCFTSTKYKYKHLYLLY